MMDGLLRILQECYKKRDSLALRNLTLLFSNLFMFELLSRYTMFA